MNILSDVTSVYSAVCDGELLQFLLDVLFSNNSWANYNLNSGLEQSGFVYSKIICYS